MKSFELLLDKSIMSVIKSGITILRDFPESRATLMRTLTHLPQAAKRRNMWREQNVIVPPLLIVSTTEECNLRCVGCYARANYNDLENEMTRAHIDKLLEQAVDAGCSIILLAGGEPLLSSDWLEAVASRSELLGLVFTNGTLLDEKRVSWFAYNRSMIPVFSIEGDTCRTNERRGDGVAECVERAMSLLTKRKMPFGLSITTGEHNINEVACLNFLTPYIQSGCRLVIYTEYVPVDENTELLALTEESKLALQHFCQSGAKGNDLILIPFPGDETKYNGCLAAGRGFVHISASGALEPCPFAAFSDRNVIHTSFEEALSSPLFKKIRSESHLLHEGVGGCALRNMKLKGAI